MTVSTTRNQLFEAVMDLADAQAEWGRADGVAAWDLHGESSAIERDIYTDARQAITDGDELQVVEAVLQCAGVLCMFAGQHPQLWAGFQALLHGDADL